MKSTTAKLGIAALASLAAAFAFGHHSFSMFNRDVERVITGSVARWAFNNPHSWLYINVAAEDGTTELWSFEAAAPPQLITRGITGKTFEPGSEVTVMFCPLADGRPGGAIGFVKKADGSFIVPNDGGCRGGDEAVERWKGWMEKGYTSNTEALAAN